MNGRSLKYVMYFCSRRCVGACLAVFVFGYSQFWDQQHQCWVGRVYTGCFQTLELVSGEPCFCQSDTLTANLNWPVATHSVRPWVSPDSIMWFLCTQYFWSCDMFFLLPFLLGNFPLTLGKFGRLPVSLMSLQLTPSYLALERHCWSWRRVPSQNAQQPPLQPKPSPTATRTRSPNTRQSLSQMLQQSSWSGHLPILSHLWHFHMSVWGNF